MAFEPDRYVGSAWRKWSSARPADHDSVEATRATHHWLVFPIVLFVCTRVTIFAFAWIALYVMPSLYHEGGPREFMRAYPWVDGLYRWDSEWFYLIATRGYWEAHTTNFFPLFPLLGRAVSALTGIHTRFALIIIANVASFLAYLVVYRVYLALSDETSARSALILLAAFPFAFFQAAAYPESLMMLFSALAIWLALRGNHIWAGVALGIGVLARHLTMFAGAALLVAQLQEHGVNPRRFLFSPAILGLIIPWLFLGGYCLFLYQTFGDPLTFYHARSNPIWGERAWWSILDLLRTSARDAGVRVMFTYIPFALLMTIGACALLARRQWLALAVSAVVFMLMLWMIGVWGLGRYTASCWPAFLPFGMWLARYRQLQGPLVVALALFQGLYFYFFIRQYAVL